MNWDVRKRIEDILTGGFGASTLVSPHVQFGIYASGPHIKITSEFIDVDEVVIRSNEIEELAEFLVAFVNERNKRGLAGKVLSCLGRGPSDDVVAHEQTSNNENAKPSGGAPESRGNPAQGGAAKEGSNRPGARTPSKASR